jgi:hypothetical protein
MDKNVKYPFKNIPDMLEEIRREIETRERVYPRWINEGKIKREDAEHRYMCMKSIEDFLQKEQARRVGVQTNFFDKATNPFSPIKNQEDENINTHSQGI